VAENLLENGAFHSDLGNAVSSASGCCVWPCHDMETMNKEQGKSLKPAFVRIDKTSGHTSKGNWPISCVL
jgi:hypothetical protein